MHVRWYVMNFQTQPLKYGTIIEMSIWARCLIKIVFSSSIIKADKNVQRQPPAVLLFDILTEKLGQQI